MVSSRSSNNKNKKSYLEAIKSNIKRIPTVNHSLLSTDADTNGSNTRSNDVSAAQAQEIKTRIYRHARSLGGYFLDISKVPTITDEQHLTITGKQYGAVNFNGI